MLEEKITNEYKSALYVQMETVMTVTGTLNRDKCLRVAMIHVC